ncbi:nitroreductase family protein [Bifidobacterium amazonense]|uniref:Nitroreductase n=2 Tax=Bifidobacterium TaxID=1678 RepID=A0A086ZYJ0_9BIFI|nr:MULTISPECIES: nitroreductase family protein [Bifidobacterium]KFI51590.1 Nitroreductase [Bifidobacterium biavatii DSM 23969]MCH9274944.1 nitroreductase family protein [Bifidobacterium amazonense]
MKNTLKKLTPEPVIAWLRGAESDLKLYHETMRQMRRFRRNYARRGTNGKTQVESRLIFFTHQIEKGLSHEHFRYGFGRTVLEQFAPLLKQLKSMDPNVQANPVWASAIDALHEYRVKHERAGKDLSAVRALFDPDIWNMIGEADGKRGGILVIKSADKADNASKTFRELSESRHSLREFADERVSAEEIMRCIDVAMRTPSVCNRQPTRVHVITNPDVIAKAMPLQGGYRGYAMPPALVLITADNRAFMSQDERNEGFVDGGLFGMSLLLALEEAGLAACPLNTMLPAKRDDATRRLLHLLDSEFLVMYIAVGHFLPESKTCHSQRFTASDIATVIA